MADTPRRNVHATALVLGDRGVLIAGAPGSGKTTLALALIDHMLKAGRFARLVSDDQVFVEDAHGKLIAAPPAAIAGLVEIRGLGPRPIAWLPVAVIDLLVKLVPRSEMERLPERAEAEIGAVRVPRLELAEHDAAANVLAVSARLALPPFA